MTNYLTQCYDNLRTGWNPGETILTPESVQLKVNGPTRLGQLFAYQVQGQVYAQPLYMENVPVAGSSKDIVLVATEENWVYAFDAGSQQQLWARQLIPSGEQLVTPGDIGNCNNVQPYIGITSTPVIDPTTMTAYVVGKTRSTLFPWLFYHRLYGIKLASGADFMPPVEINATAGAAVFSPQWQLQRPGLLLMNGIVYIGFGAHCDFHPPPYHGWVFAWYTTSPQWKLTAFTSTQSSCAGISGCAGIWQSGRGLAGDAQGFVYCMTGNGPFADGTDYGDTVLKLDLQNLGGVADYFTPCNQSYMLQNDADLGSGGPMILPDQPGPFPHLLVAAGKEGTIYLLNRDNLGKYKPMPSGWPESQQCSDNAVAVLFRVLGTESRATENRDALFGGPAYYAPAGTSPRIYYCAENDAVKVFTYDQQGHLAGPVDHSAGTITYGAIPVVSSNGTQVGTGILWVLSRGNPRVLTAYDLNPSQSLLSGPLCEITVGTWTGRLGPPATVVDGRVYAACDNQVVVFGLVPAHWMAAGQDADGRLEVFGVGTGSALGHTAQTASGNWSGSGWAPLAPGSAITSDLQTARNTTDDTLDVFARGTDNALWHIRQTAPGNWTGAGWAPLGGSLPG